MTRAAATVIAVRSFAIVVVATWAGYTADAVLTAWRGEGVEINSTASLVLAVAASVPVLVGTIVWLRAGDIAGWLLRRSAALPPTATLVLTGVALIGIWQAALGASGLVSASAALLPPEGVPDFFTRTAPVGPNDIVALALSALQVALGVWLIGSRERIAVRLGGGLG